MKKLWSLILLLLFPAIVYGQSTAARFDWFAFTTNPNGGLGNLRQVLAFPNAQIQVCTVAGSTSCVTSAVTYTDDTMGTPCSPSTPVVLPGTSTCTAYTDLDGSIGWWAAQGEQLQYFVTFNNQVYGPYPVTMPGGAGSGSNFSLNTLVGAVTLAQGSNMSFGTVGNTITLNSTGGCGTGSNGSIVWMSSGACAPDSYFKDNQTSGGLSYTGNGANFTPAAGGARYFFTSNTTSGGPTASIFQVLLNDSTGTSASGNTSFGSTTNGPGSSIFGVNMNGSGSGSGEITLQASDFISLNAPDIQILGLTTSTPCANSLNIDSGGNMVEGACNTAGGAVLLNPPSGSQDVNQLTGTWLLTNRLNGDYYASQFGTSSTGIATAISTGCTGTGCQIKAGINYANTELLPPIVREVSGYGTGNYLQMPTWPGLTHVVDDRGGFHSEIFVAPTGTGSYYPSATGPQFPFGLYFNSAYDVTQIGNTVDQQTSVNQSIFNGPGNQINGFGGVNLKSYDFGPVTTMVSSDQGQHIGEQENINCYGVGDCLGGSREMFVVCDGGQSTYNDEGCHGGDFQVGEGLVVYRGTIASVTSSTVMSDTVTTGPGTQGNGRFRIDLTDAVSGSWPTAYVSNTVPHQLLSPPLVQFVGTSFATGWVGMVCDPTIDTCNNGLDPTGRINSVAGGYAPGLITFDVVSAGGTPSLRTGYNTTTTGIPTTGPQVACVADSENFETTTYTVVSSSQIMLNLRKPHLDGMTVGIGGQCQTGLEITGGTYIIGGTHYRQVWPIVGNFNGTQLIVWDHDSQQGYSGAELGNNGTAYCSTDSNPTVFSASGTTVTVFDTTVNTAPDPHFAGQTVIVTTGNSTYNGTVAVSYVTAYEGGEWQHAYRYTLGTAPSGAAPTSGTVQFCNTSYNLYPALEVLNVLDPSTNTVDGYAVVAPNSIVGVTAFQVGDSVEEPPYFWQSDTYSAAPDQIGQMLPRPPLSRWETAGLNYQNLMSGGYVGWTVKNSSPLTKYVGYGGTAPPPETAYIVDGLFTDGVEWTQPPALGGFLLQVDSCQPAPYNCSDPLSSPIGIYEGPLSGDQIFDNTYAGAFTFNTNAIQINGFGFPATMFSPIFGTTAFSTDLSGFTPDGTVEAKAFQFWSSFTPPTGYQHVELYGDSSSGIGMIFPVSSASAALNGGNFTVGSLQYYVPGTTTANKTAGFSVNGVIGQISVDDATIGDAGGTLLAKSLLATGIVDGGAPNTTVPTSTCTIGGTQSGYYFINDGSTPVTCTLPVAAAHLQYCVIDMPGVTGIITIDTSGSGQFISVLGTDTSSGGNVTSGGALGDGACFIGQSSTQWVMTVSGGLWTPH